MITLITSNTNNDAALEIILKEVESRMSEKILIYVYWSMMIDDKDTDSVDKGIIHTIRGQVYER